MRKVALAADLDPALLVAKTVLADDLDLDLQARTALAADLDLREA